MTTQVLSAPKQTNVNQQHAATGVGQGNRVYEHINGGNNLIGGLSRKFYEKAIESASQIESPLLKSFYQREIRKEMESETFPRVTEHTAEGESVYSITDPEERANGFIALARFARD